MRKHQQIRGVEKLAVDGEGRLAVVDVEGGTGDVPFAEGVVEGVLVDDGTAGGVDEDGVRAHAFEVGGVDEVAGFRGQGQVEGDDVRLGEEGVFVHLGDAGEVFAAAVVAEDGAPEGFGKAGYPAADGSQPGDADGLAVEFAAEDALPVVGQAGDGVSTHDFAVDGNHHAYGKFGNGVGGIACGIADGDAPLAAGVEVDVVNAREGNGEHPEAGALLEEAPAEGNVADGDDVGFAGAFDEGVFVFPAVGAEGDVVSLRFERGYGGFGLASAGAEGFDEYDVHGVYVMFVCVCIYFPANLGNIFPFQIYENFAIFVSYSFML